MRNIYLYKGRLWKEIHDFRYTGGLESFHLNKGDYFVLCDGAHGGDGVGNQRMYGGRAMGILHLKKDSDLFAAVGGDGTTPSGDYNYTPGKGGWNGGADGGKAYNTSSRSGSGGGGASDIRLSNDMSLKDNGNLCTTNRIRVRLNANRSPNGRENKYFQLSEWTFYDENDNRIPVSDISASISDTEMITPTYPSGEGITNLVDMSTSTKTVFNRENVYSSFVNIYFEFSGVYTVKSYNYTTANDYEGRDPISWRVYSMNDNDEWVLVDKRVRETITTNRNTQTQLFMKQKTTYEDELFPDVILPGEYEQVRYIRAINNDSAIVLDYYPTDISDVEFIGISEPTHRTNIWECLFGTRQSSDVSQYCFGVCWQQSEIAIYLIGNKNISKGKFLYNELVRVRTNGSNVSWYNGKNLDNLVNTIETTEPRPTSSSYQLCVMGASSNGSTPNPALSASGKCYGFKIFENNELIRNYVPAVRYDGLIGLCCTITGKFHGVSNSSYFKTDLDYRDKDVPVPRSLYSRIIVGAGSGGGRSYSNDDDRFREFLGSGGSAIGTLFAKANEYYATQNNGYSFGIGQVPPTKIYSSTCGAYGAGGGGGGWFGGYGNPYVHGEGYSSTAGGGGSSYVLTKDSFKPEGYTPDDNYWFTDPFMDSGVADYARIIVAEPIDVLLKDDVIYAFCIGEIDELPIVNNMKLQVECYGGAGGNRHRITNASIGGYTKGTINVYPGDKMYVNVGGTGIGFNIGDDAAYNKLLRPVLGYNGGGKPYYRNNSNNYHSGGGGGATDIRICENRPNIKLPTAIRYARMEVLERRNEHDHGSDDTKYEWFQMSQLFFKDSSDIIGVSEINAYINEAGDIPVTLYAGNEATENVSMLIDGSTDTKFACKWDNYINIIMKFDKDVSGIESYGFSTADDYPVRDPFVWRIYVSENGTNWVLLDTKMKTDLPETRFATYEFNKESFETIDPPSLHTRVLVAGGGGGNMVETYNGNNGGGTNGGTNTSGYAHRQSGAGGQTKAARDMNNTSYGRFEAEGVFGHGGNGTISSSTPYSQPGGGAGWFGGSGSIYDGNRTDIRSGCGGSGYVLTADSFKPEGYNVSDRYYVQNGETVLGGNNLSRVTTMCKITVIETTPIRILMRDKNGVKSFDKENGVWTYLMSEDPTVDDFLDYGSNTIITDEGLEKSYDVLMCPGSDDIGGKTLSIDKVFYDVIPSKQRIRHVARTPMNPRSISLDAEYDEGSVDVEITSKRDGVGDMAELTIDLNASLKTDETEPKFFSVYIEASLNLNGNRYIPPKPSDEEVKPVPKPGDPDYYEKDLLPVGRKNSIPREYHDYLDKVGDTNIQSIHSAIAKCYDREVYIFSQLNDKIIRMMKYNTITKETKTLFEIPPFYGNGEGPGDFEIVGNKVVYSSSRNASSNYHWKVYDMDTGTITSIEISNNNYRLSPFGKIVKLNSEEVVIPTCTGVIIYNVPKNTYVEHTGKTSQTAYRDFAVGNKYYAFVRDANVMTLIDRNTFAVTTINLPDSTATVITFYDNKFYLAKNGALYVFNEDTLTIENTYLTPWSNCRTINVEMNVAYVICKNSNRLWIYDFKSKRYDSIFMSWAIPEWSNMVFRPATMGGSLWLPYWKLLNISYVGLAKYNFGQKYGQYYIRYCSDVQDEFEFDDRFVTFYDTYATVHTGVITKDTVPVEDMPYKMITMSKKEYSQIRNVSFECSLVDKE